MPEEPKAEAETPSRIVDLTAGGVNVRLEGPDIVGADAYALWQKLYDTIHNGRNRVGSGSGFILDRAEPTAPSGWLGEGGPKMTSDEIPMPENLRPRAPGCFHPWPGCNCGA